MSEWRNLAKDRARAVMSALINGTSAPNQASPQYKSPLGEMYTGPSRVPGLPKFTPEIQKAMANGASIAPPPTNAGMLERIGHRTGQAAGLFRKALQGVGGKPEDPKGQSFDPLAIFAPYQYRERPSGVSFDTLRAMSMRIPVIAAIHATRLNQIGVFGTLQEDPHGLGFKIVPKSKRVAKNPTQATRNKIEELECFFRRCGHDYNGRHKVRPNLEQVLRMCGRDSLVYDQYGIQIVRDRVGRPAEFYAMPAHTIRFAYQDDSDGGWNLDPTKVRYVQAWRNEIVEEFTAEDLIFGIRNPRSDMEVGGYGLSELELLIHTVTAILWAEQYNYRFFSSGSTIKGILNLKGTLTNRQMRSFRRQWFNLVSGVHNAWRTPIFNAEDVQFVNMHANNRDMEFIEWLYYLIKLATGIYQIDPSEINFQFGNIGQAVQVFESNNEAKQRLSRDRGLRPLVVTLQGSLQEIMDELEPDFRVVLAGLDAKTPDQKANLAETLSRTTHTINEVRDEVYNLPSIEGGDIIRDSTYLGAVQQAAAQEQQQMLTEDAAFASLLAGNESDAISDTDSEAQTPA